jgi:dipeptidyl aminopeptidase/acylaminoacyl peptidase
VVPRAFLSVVVLSFVAVPCFGQEPRTVAEQTDYQATSRHADVLRFCEELAKRSPSVRLTDMGTSGEGRNLPLVIIADPPVNSPEDAKRSGKLVVYAQANIHAGEVDGKEALQMLARDVALDTAKPLLKDLVILLCPDFNPDGNEKIDPKHRPEQNGPVGGVGVRTNAGGLDLNRDFVKLESPEVRALVKLLNRWDPAMVIDCHTTDGSLHRYTETYDGPRHPNAGDLVAFSRDKMLPEIGQRLEKKGFPSFYYGNFSADHHRWTTYEPWPRYGVQYVGLRGRLGILSESYVYAPFRDRVLASRDFVRLCFEYVTEHKAEVRRLIGRKDETAKLALKTKPEALDKTFPLLGYVETVKSAKETPNAEKKEYTVRYYGREVAEEAAPRPFAYLFPAKFAKAVEVLQRHGVGVEELREDVELDATIFRVEKVNRAERAYQGHRTIAPTVFLRTESRLIPAGTILVRTDRRFGSLAALLLDPRAEDGLTVWNFFDDDLRDGQDAPVMAMQQSAPIIAGPVRPLAEERTTGKRITPDALLKGGRRAIDLSGNPVGGLIWLDDGEHFLQVKENRLYKVAARTGRATLFVDPEKLARSLIRMPALDRGTVEDLSRNPRYHMDPNRTGALFEHENDLYFGRFDGMPGVRLTKSPGKKEYAEFSPDGRFVAFVRGGNLVVVDMTSDPQAGTPTERALTTDGGGAVLNGKADWVYGEEIFDRDTRAFWWSPDARYIAYLRFDDGPVHKFTLVNPLPLRQVVEAYAYPKAGDPNPVVTLHVVSAAGGDPVAVDLKDYSPTASLISRVGWLPDSSRVFFYAQNRSQTWLDFCTSPAAGGSTTRLFREKSSAWCEDPGPPHMLADGSFLFPSERTGWKHLYRYSAAGKLVGPVTSGSWELRSPGGGPFQGKPVQRVDEKNGWVYFTATKDSPTATNLYRAKLDASGVIERLTPGAGEHSANVSPVGNLFVDSHSDPTTPTSVLLRSTSGGGLVRTLDTNPVYARDEYRLGSFRRVTIPMKDGFVLEGSIIEPPDFDPARKYPVWFQTYGGPHAPTVVDSWRGGRIDEQALASMGLIVFRCDPRSASGKGACSAWTCYRQLGVQECKDIEEAIDWLCRSPWIDAKRIGMNGGSYGGFLTAYCLTHSTKFAAGVAAAPVTDWRNYDSIYTERYMNTPQENPDGYRSTSVVRAADKLHGRLLLVHGLMDDNVHPQNTVQLVDALERADKDFELMVYPRAKHGGFGRHNERQLYEFIRRTVLNGNDSAGPVDISGTSKSKPAVGQN